MIKQFEAIIYFLFGASKEENVFRLFNPAEQFDPSQKDDTGVIRALNSAFLISLAGPNHHLFTQAMGFLTEMLQSPSWSQIAGFYLNGIRLVQEEIDSICSSDRGFAKRLNDLYDYLSRKDMFDHEESIRGRIWSVFFPEGVGVEKNKQASIRDLRKKRTVTITELNQSPIADPVSQVLFTSNVLLTIPPSLNHPDMVKLGNRLKERLKEIALEQQIYWYDHPIQMGVAPENNEVLYGLKGLEGAFAFERKCGIIDRHSRPVCLLSVSVTHQGLHEIAKRYLQETVFLAGGIQDMDLYAFTEADARLIIDDILTPAIRHYGLREAMPDLLDVFGVDGEYGRHYNFLKAIAAFWKILIRPDIKATFKIDLDQVFPQQELKHQTGSTLSEHLKTPLWGSRGMDSKGRPLDMGMIAGALVNEKDINMSLFTPDIRFPDRQPAPDEYIFYSQIPQALSTEAEMMTRYTDTDLDGKQKALQRIHVTGGTNGILIESLRRYRPFTPSFIGRAEDQAYILSVLYNENGRLAYVHKDGLIMRHDKEVFAQEAIRSAHVGKLIGDYIRILYFSSYSQVLRGGISKVKDEVDPFTGCFISSIPRTVVHLRFALQAASFFDQGDDEQGLAFVMIGTRRLSDALDFVDEKKGMVKQQYEREQVGWDLFYDALNLIEDGLREGDEFSKDLQKKAFHIINQCAIM